MKDQCDCFSFVVTVFRICYPASSICCLCTYAGINQRRSQLGEFTWSPKAWRPMTIGFTHDVTSLGIFLQMMASLNTVPPRMLRIVPFGDFHIFFSLNSARLKNNINIQWSNDTYKSTVIRVRFSKVTLSTNLHYVWKFLTQLILRMCTELTVNNYGCK